MKKYQLNGIVHLLLLLTFFPCVYSAYMLQYGLKHFSLFTSCARTLSFLRFGLTRHEWLGVHVWTGWIFSGLVIVHLFLYRRQISARFHNRAGIEKNIQDSPQS